MKRPETAARQRGHSSGWTGHAQRGTQRIMAKKHDSASYSFGANDHSDGRAFIMLEPCGKGLEAIGDGALYLKLREGVSIRQAEALARQLNEMVESVDHARFGGSS